MSANPPTPKEEKAQHYIPKFYLKGFTDKQGKLWVCEKFKSIRESKPKSEAHRPDYYTHAEQGLRDETAEDTLEEIESRAAPVMRKMANPEFAPSPEQMGHVYLFVAFMFARVPSWREYLDKLLSQHVREEQLNTAKDKDKFHKLCFDAEQDAGKPLGMDYEAMRQYVLAGDYEIVQGSTAFNLGSMFQSALNVAQKPYRAPCVRTSNGFSEMPTSCTRPLAISWPRALAPSLRMRCLRCCGRRLRLRRCQRRWKYCHDS